MLTICQALDILIIICYTYYMFETIIIAMLSTIPAGLIVSSIVLGIIWIFVLCLLGKYVLIPLLKATIRGFLNLNPLGQVFLMALVLQLSF